MTIKKERQTHNESTDTNRRKALKLAAGGGLVSGVALTSNTWTKPVVNAVLLPAHAQTSLEEGEMDDSMDGDMDGSMDGPPATFSGSTELVGKSPSMDRKSILDLFVTPVNAGDETVPMLGVDTIEAFATQTGEDAFDFQFVVRLLRQECNNIFKDKIISDEFPPTPPPIMPIPVPDIRDDISLFFEISASGGSGDTSGVINCDGSTTQSVGFDYTASDDDIVVSDLSIAVEEVFSSPISITMAPGGAPLTAAVCTLCP